MYTGEVECPKSAPKPGSSLLRLLVSCVFLTIASDVFFLVNRLCAKGKPA